MLDTCENVQDMVPDFELIKKLSQGEKVIKCEKLSTPQNLKSNYYILVRISVSKTFNRGNFIVSIKKMHIPLNSELQSNR